MQVRIKQPLLPFSHTPGTCCPIPRTTWEAQVFPSKAILRDFTSEQSFEIPLPFSGALEGFTVMLNLERGRIEVFSKAKKRLFLSADSHPAIKEYPVQPSKARLSLGVHKKQDWDLVKRRADLAEIFPFWLKLAQWIPEVSLPERAIGTMHLIEEGSWEVFFHAGFQGILSPRLQDLSFLGFVKEEAIPKGVSSLGLLHQGARQIEALFFREEGNLLHLLPSLPIHFHAGRFVHLTTSQGDRIDMEWSKKSLKKAILYPNSAREIRLILQKKLKGFRLRADLRKRGKQVPIKDSIELQPNQVLYLDRFSG